MRRNHLAPSTLEPRQCGPRPRAIFVRGSQWDLEIQLRKPATRSAEIETCRAPATLPEPRGWAGRGAARGDRSWTAGRGSGKAGADALPPPCLVDLLFKKRWPCNSSVPTWGNREGLCPADISGRAKAGSGDRRIMRAPAGVRARGDSGRQMTQR